MTLLWTKSGSTLSKLIRLLTGDDCSHFAIVLYDNKPGEIMFESNLLGTHPAFLKTSLKTHEIVHKMTIEVPQDMEDQVWDRIVKSFDGKPYDYAGALYLGIHKLMHRLFGRAIPTSNKWANCNAFFCDEIYTAFVDVPGLPDIGVSNGMRTPHDVYQLLQEIK